MSLKISPFSSAGGRADQEQHAQRHGRAWQPVEAIDHAVKQAALRTELGAELAERGGLELGRSQRLGFGVRPEGLDRPAHVLQPAAEQPAEQALDQPHAFTLSANSASVIR